MKSYRLGGALGNRFSSYVNKKGAQTLGTVCEALFALKSGKRVIKVGKAPHTQTGKLGRWSLDDTAKPVN